ncbi:MAG: radical SAM protein [Planctomycetes bacterium]|nr:radical SAM protein [Planctomycetota bacterium]
MGKVLGSVFQWLRGSTLGSAVRKSLRKGGVVADLAKLPLQGVIDWEFPRSFNIEPTSHCNIACIMCPRERPNKTDGFMDWDLYRKIVDETAKYGPRSITLHKDGEPLMHKRLGEMIEYTKKINPRHKLYISSNGLILKEQHAQAFIKHKLDVFHVSIGAVNPDTYKTVRGGNLEDLEQRVRMLLDMKKAQKSEFPKVAVQIIRMPETVGEVQAFIDKWEPLGVFVTVEDVRHWAGGIEQREGEDPVHVRERHPCHALWFAPSINWDGQVSFCCFDWDSQGVIGDVREKTLAEIWQGERIKWHRDKHLRGEYNYPECANCDHYLDYPDLWFEWQKGTPREGWETDIVAPGMKPRPANQMPKFHITIPTGEEETSTQRRN